ncbi:hypothetical protein [Chryseobacterium wanjuense]
MIYLKVLRIYLFFLLFFIFPCKFYSQKNAKKIDSIKKLIDESYYKGNIDKKDLTRYIADLYYLSKESGYAKGQSYSIFEEFRMYSVDGNFNIPLKKLEEGIDLAQSQKDYNTLCRLLLLYQKLIFQLNYLTESKQVLSKCEDYNKLVDDKEEQRINTIYILLAKGNILTNNEGLSRDMNLVLSLKKQAYNESLKISNYNKRKKYIVINVLESLAWSTALSENLAEARKLTHQTDELLIKYSNNDLIIQNLITKGAIENIAKNYELAIRYLSEVISLAKQNHDSNTLYDVYPMISASYGQLKDYERSTLYSWRAKHLADSIGAVKQKLNDTLVINLINKKIFNKEKENSNNATILVLIIAIILIEILLYYKKPPKEKNLKKAEIPLTKPKKPAFLKMLKWTLPKNSLVWQKKMLMLFY